MRKKRLMELKPLKVMNRHIADAKKTEISLSTLEKQRGEPGKYRMYCRAAVEKGILKVYLFAVTDIEENINFPRYRLFISRKERRFITYDEKLKKWRKALLESILWDVRTNLGNIYVNGCDTKIIQKYLKTMQPAIRALEEFQANIRKEQRIRHDKKLTDSWDQVMKTVSGLPKNWIGWVSKYGITEHYIFYKYQKNGAMAPLQIKNYLEKQAAESGESVKDLIKTWKDYLNMAIRVGVNVQDSVIYRARRLMQRHNEMIKEIEAKDLILRAGELEKKYPGLNRICRDLKKYEYADKEYQIVVPEKVDDILYEAKLMHHCVNNTETYYERMSQQESYILFLRKAEQPTEAYYTLEVEPDGTIRQTRTFYNQQNEDIELARDFLVKWQKQLKKKLAKEDYKLAVKSQSLRKKEIDELRSKGVRVNGVGYCNKLLAEILEEDLMEAGNRELEEQAA